MAVLRRRVNGRGLLQRGESALTRGRFNPRAKVAGRTTQPARRPSKGPNRPATARIPQFRLQPQLELKAR